jgi:hypothetical protein
VLSFWTPVNNPDRRTFLRQPSYNFPEDGRQHARSDRDGVTFQPVPRRTRTLGIVDKLITARLTIRRPVKIVGPAFLAFLLHDKNMPNRAKGRKKPPYLIVLSLSAGRYYLVAISYFCVAFKSV